MKKSLTLKTVALAMASIYLCQQVLFAQELPLSNEVMKAPSLTVLPKIAEAELPPELGTLVEQHGENPSVMLIQDAHGHFEAQQNTAALLEYLHRETKFDALFLEGSIGSLKAERIRFFEDHSKTMQAAEALMERSDIGGAEYFLLKELTRQGREFPAYGMENPGLYFKNFSAYQEAIRAQASARKYLDAEWVGLHQKAGKMLSPQLFDFYKQWLSYARQEDLMRALPVLEKAARKHLGVDFRDARAQISWPMMTRVIEIKKREKRINQAKAEEELKRLAEWVSRQSLTDESVAQVLNHKDFFGESRISSLGKFSSRRVFWEAIYTALAPRGFDFKKYPNLSLLEGSRILESELEADGLMGEMSRVKDLIFSRLTRSESESGVIHAAEKTLLLEKMATLRLTRDEFEKIGSEKGLRNIPRLKPALSFYRAAFLRDRIMAERAVRTLSAQKIKNAVMIAGGFHTQGLTDLLRAKNISYAVFRPHLSAVESDEAYQAVMMGRPLTAPLFAGKTLRAFSWMNEPRYFNRLPKPNQGRYQSVLNSLKSTSRSEIRAEDLAPSIHERMMSQIIFNRKIIYQGNSAVYKPQVFEANVQDRTDSNDPSVVMVRNALTYLKNNNFQSDQRAVFLNLIRKTSVVAIDLPTVFFHGDARYPLTRVMQISFRRRAIILSKGFLEALDPNSEDSQEYVAIILYAGQILLDKYSEILKKLDRRGVTRKLLSEALLEGYREVSLEVDKMRERFAGSVLSYGQYFESLDPRHSLDSLDIEQREWERKRVERQAPQYDQDADFVTALFSDWNQEEGYDPIRVMSSQYAVAKHFNSNAQMGMAENDSRLILIEKARELQKIAFFYESNGSRERASYYYAKALNLLKATQKLDQQGLFPFQAQAQIVYFMIRSGNFEGFQQELKRLLTADYVPKVYREMQKQVQRPILSVWAQEAALDLLYKIQFYKSIDPSFAQNRESINNLEKELVELYKDTIDLPERMKDQQKKKFGVNLLTSKESQLDRPFRIFVPEYNEILEFSWEKRKLSENEYLVVVSASLVLASTERPGAVSRLYFSLKRIPGKDEWRAVAKAVEDRGRISQPIKVTPVILKQYPNLATVMLRLGLKLASASGSKNFHFIMDADKRLEVGLRIDTEHHSQKPHVIFSVNPDHAMVRDYAELKTNTNPSARSELRAEDGDKDISPSALGTVNQIIEILRSEVRSWDDNDGLQGFSDIYLDRPGIDKNSGFSFRLKKVSLGAGIGGGVVGLLLTSWAYFQGIMPVTMIAAILISAGVSGMGWITYAALLALGEPDLIPEKYSGLLGKVEAAIKEMKLSPSLKKTADYVMAGRSGLREENIDILFSNDLDKTIMSDHARQGLLTLYKEEEGTDVYFIREETDAFLMAVRRDSGQMILDINYAKKLSSRGLALLLSIGALLIRSYRHPETLPKISEEGAAFLEFYMRWGSEPRFDGKEHLHDDALVILAAARPAYQAWVREDASLEEQVGWIFNPRRSEVRSDEASNNADRFVPSFILPAGPEYEKWVTFIDKLFKLGVPGSSVASFYLALEKGWEDPNKKSQILKMLSLLRSSHAGVPAVVAKNLIDIPVELWLSSLSNKKMFSAAGLIAEVFLKAAGAGNPWQKVTETVEDQDLGFSWSVTMPQVFTGSGEYQGFGKLARDFIAKFLPAFQDLPARGKDSHSKAHYVTDVENVEELRKSPDQISLHSFDDRKIEADRLEEELQKIPLVIIYSNVLEHGALPTTILNAPYPFLNSKPMMEELLKAANYKIQMRLDELMNVSINRQRKFSFDWAVQNEKHISDENNPYYWVSLKEIANQVYEAVQSANQYAARMIEQKEEELSFYLSQYHGSVMTMSVHAYSGKSWVPVGSAEYNDEKRQWVTVGKTSRSEARMSSAKLSLKDTKLNLIEGNLNFWTLIPEQSGSRERIMSAFRDPLMSKRVVLPENYRFTTPEDLLDTLDRLSKLKNAPHIAGIIIDWDAFGSWQQRIVSKIKKLDKTGRIALIAVGNKAPGNTDSKSVVYYTPFGFSAFADDLAAALKTKPLVPRSSQGLTARTGAKFLAYGTLGAPQKEVKPQPIPFAELKANEGKQVRLEVGIKLGRDTTVKGAMDVFIASVSKKNDEKAEVMIDRVFVPKTVMYAKGDLLYVRNRAQEMNWHLSIGIFPTEQDFVIYSVKPLRRSEARVLAGEASLIPYLSSFQSGGSKEVITEPKGYPELLRRELEEAKKNLNRLRQHIQHITEKYATYSGIIKALMLPEYHNLPQIEDHLADFLEGRGSLEKLHILEEELRSLKSAVEKDKADYQSHFAEVFRRRSGRRAIPQDLRELTVSNQLFQSIALHWNAFYFYSQNPKRPALEAIEEQVIQKLSRKPNRELADIKKAVEEVLRHAKNHYLTYSKKQIPVSAEFKEALIESWMREVYPSVLENLIGRETVDGIFLKQIEEIFIAVRDGKANELMKAMVPVLYASVAGYIKQARLLSESGHFKNLRSAYEIFYEYRQLIPEPEKLFGKTLEMARLYASAKGYSYYALNKPINAQPSAASKHLEHADALNLFSKSAGQDPLNYDFAGNFSRSLHGISFLTDDTEFLGVSAPIITPRTRYRIYFSEKVPAHSIADMRTGYSVTVSHHVQRVVPAQLEVIAQDEQSAVIDVTLAAGSLSHLIPFLEKEGLNKFDIAVQSVGGISLEDLNLEPGEAKKLEGRNFEKILLLKRQYFEAMDNLERNSPQDAAGKYLELMVRQKPGLKAFALNRLRKLAEGGLKARQGIARAFVRVFRYDDDSILHEVEHIAFEFAHEHQDLIPAMIDALLSQGGKIGITEADAKELLKLWDEHQDTRFVQVIINTLKLKRAKYFGRSEARLPVPNGNEPVLSESAKSELRNEIKVKDVFAVLKNEQMYLGQREEAVRRLDQFSKGQLAGFETRLLDFANAESNPISLRAMVVRILSSKMQYAESDIPKWYRVRRQEMLETIQKAKSAPRVGSKHQLIKKIDDAWVEMPEETPWLLDNLRPYLDGKAGGDGLGLVKESIRALGIIGPPADEFGAADLLETLLRNTERKWKIENEVQWALSRIKSEARSEARSGSQPAVKVSEDMTAKIVARGMEWLVPVLFAADDVAVNEDHQKREAAVLSGLLNGGANVILPASLIVQMNDSARKQYLNLIRQAVEMSGAKDHKIIFAGAEASSLAEIFSGYEVFRGAPEMHKIVQTNSADENILADRMKGKAVSASFEGLDETSNLVLIPSFKISTDEFIRLKPSEQLQYMAHLTQLQLLAAEALKDQLSDKTANRKQVLRDFLTKVGIQFSEEGGFLKPSAQSLVAADLNKLAQTYQLTSKSA